MYNNTTYHHPYHARMARRSQHLRCSLSSYVREANERTTGLRLDIGCLTLRPKCVILRPKCVILRPLGRFAFGKTPRGPRCARQARQRLARYWITIIHYLTSSRAARATPLSCSSSKVFTQSCTYARRARGSYTA